MTMTQRLVMAKGDEDPFVLAGTGGVTLGEARTNHEGRQAILLLRGKEDATEFIALVATMGITPSLRNYTNQAKRMRAGFLERAGFKTWLMNLRLEQKAILGPTSILFFSIPTLLQGNLLA